jgi:hypothetical protein
MNCSICDKEIEKELVYTVSDTITLGYFSIVLKNRYFAICTDCFSKWNKLLELLFQLFREKKEIDSEIIKRILNENA